MSVENGRQRQTGTRDPSMRWRVTGLVGLVLAALFVSVPPPPPVVAVGPPPLDTWTVVRAPDGVALRGVSFVDALNGWAVGDCPRQAGATICAGDARILRTTDGGATWGDPLDSGTMAIGAHAGLNDVSFTDQLHGSAVGFAQSNPALAGNLRQSGNQTILTTSDGGETWQRTYTNSKQLPTNRLSKISCTDQLRCHAVGGARTILATSDGGTTWHRQASGNGLPETDGPNGPSLFPLFGVSFTDGPGCAVNGTTSGFTSGCYGHAVGDDRSIIATTDGGETWTVQVPGATLLTNGSGFRDVWFTDHLYGWALGAMGVLRTTDGGAHWIPAEDPFANVAVTFTDRLKGWRVGQDATGRAYIRATSDGGQTWQPQYVCTSSAVCTATSEDRVQDVLEDVTFNSDPATGVATGFAVGDKGSILKLTSSILPTTANLYSVSCTDASRCHAVGRPPQPDDLPGPYGKKPPDDRTQPTLLATIDGGKTWEPQMAHNEPLTGVSFTDGPGCPPDAPRGCYGHATTESRLMWATTDGGRNWAAQESATNVAAGPSDLNNLNKGLNGMRSLVFTDGPGCAEAGAASGFLSGCYGHAIGGSAVVATSDGGRTWRPQPTGDIGELLAVSFTDHLNGGALARNNLEQTGNYLLRTTDGGAFWEIGTPIPGTARAASEGELLDIAFTDGPGCPPEFPRGCHGHAVGEGGKILITTDGGTTWQPQVQANEANWSTADLLAVSFTDTVTGVAVGKNGTILVTGDGGQTWASRLSNTTAVLRDVSVTKDAATGVATAFVVGDSATVRKVVIAPPAPTVTAMSPADGPTAGGTAVRITGANFTPAAAVSFGSANATPTAVSPTEITVPSPAQGEGPVEVKVTTAGGTAVVPGNFTYFVPPSTGGGGGDGGGGGGGGDGEVGTSREVLVTCPAVPQPVAGQLALPGGYSLVGMPAGTVVASGAPLYGWLNQGAGGRYSVDDPNKGLEAGRGYWAFSACPRVINLAGAGNSSASSALGAYRASMVGNPSGTGPAAVSGHDFAARWDPRLNSGAGGYVLSDYRQPRVLAVGEGIWVFSYQDTTIHVAG